MRIDGLPPALRPNSLLGSSLIAAIADAAAAFPVDGGETRGAPAVLTPATPATALVQPTTSMAMLVALASIDPAIERRRKLAADADRGLGLLERLRDELDTGLATPAQLQALAGWVAAFTVPDEPALAQIARDIDLRVRVELAKHDLTA